MSAETILEGLAGVRDVLVAKALAEAIAACGPPGDTARLPLRSEQHWLQTFSTPDVTSEQMRRFLSSFQLVRDAWDYGKVADLVNGLIGREDFNPLSDIESLAEALRVVTERRTPQTIAASSICMFAKPAAKVFIMGELPCYSARLALWGRSNRATPALLGLPFHPDGWEAREEPETEDYAAYVGACEVVLDELGTSTAFQKALEQFSDYLSSVPGPMRTRAVVPMDFVERRLLEGMMTCEGWYIRHWLEYEEQTGRLAPSDEGIVGSRVVPRRGQDVFPSELAAKFGY